MINTQGSRFGDGPASLEQRGAWCWFTVLGIALILLGAIASANLFITTVAATFYVGAIMLAAGTFQIIHAFGVKKWARFAFWLLSGLLYLAAAVAMFLDPLFAATLLTLFLAVSLGLSGGLRLFIALTTRTPSGWGWMAVSAVASIATALVIALGWPVNSIWVLGLILSIDLLFQGVALLLIGLSLHSAAFGPRASGWR
ncbi:HdeD family acid-resistance protein [Sphingobium indicum]